MVLNGKCNFAWVVNIGRTKCSLHNKKVRLLLLPASYICVLQFVDFFLRTNLFFLDANIIHAFRLLHK